MTTPQGVSPVRPPQLSCIPRGPQLPGGKGDPRLGLEGHTFEGTVPLSSVEVVSPLGSPRIPLPARRRGLWAGPGWSSRAEGGQAEELRPGRYPATG